MPSTLKYLTQNRSGFDLRASGSILALAALALLLIRPANIRLLRAEVLALLVVALAAYALAQLVLFRLYLPHRYTYPLLAFLAIAVGVLVRPGWEAMWSRPRRRLRVFGLLCAPLAIHLLAVYAFPFGPTRAPNGLASPAAIAAIGAAVGLAGAAAWVIDRPAWTSRVVVGAVLTGVTLLAAVLSVPGRRTVAMQCAQRPVARYLETLPASAVIAGDPRDMPCIPLTARRPVVISAKLAPSYEARYFRTSRARMFAMLRAYYGRSPAALVDLATRYGATHVWVRRTAVRAEATPGGVRWRKRRTRPYGAFVRRLLRDGPPAVLHLPTSCRRWSRGSSEVFDIRCIAAERDRAPVDGSARLPARGAPTDYSPRPLADSDARAG